jgi:BT1 family
MYKTAYLVMSIYSGMLFFIYLPAYRYMARRFGDTTENALLLSIYVWATWIAKPMFGYLCDYFPICNRRITPYVIIACLANLIAMGMGSTLDLSDYRLFMTIIGVSFLSFSMIDSAARKLHMTTEGMTNITMDLEERYNRLKSGPTRDSKCHGLIGKENPLQRDYSKNFGFYVSTRYAARMISLGFSTYYFENVSMNQIFTTFSGITLALLIFIVVYFQELKVSKDYTRKYQ